MRSILWMLPMAALLAAPARAEKGGCKRCPIEVEGAQTVVENTADGVAVRITAKDPAAVKAIQESAAEHFKKDASGHQCAECKKGGKACAKCAAKHAPKAGYVCPMGCAHSDKPGKCPKCGMEMTREGEKAEAKKP